MKDRREIVTILASAILGTASMILIVSIIGVEIVWQRALMTLLLSTWWLFTLVKSFFK